MSRSPERPPPFARPFVIGLVAVVLGVLGVQWWLHYQAQFVYAVTVDGEALGYVATKDEWRLALQDTKEWAERAMGVPVALSSTVELAKVKPGPGETILTGDALRQACQAEINYVTRVWAIAVAGQDVAYVRTEAEAKQVVPSLIDDYRKSLLKKGNTNVLSISLDRQVTCHESEAPVAEVGDVEQAKRILLRGTDKTLVHVVTRGESLWGIAASASLTVADLRKANPGLTNVNVIRIGQEINLIVPDPYVNLKSTEKYAYIKYLPFGESVRQDSSLWPYEGYVEKAGVHGRNEVMVEIDRVNGDEVARRLVSERNLSGSTSQYYVQGTKVYPARSGGWIWPAPGRITSPYGYRRREFHRGMDIGAPYGASVLAAKGGKVTLAGWNGGLGKCVIIDHGNGLESRYGHLSVISVSAGDSVSGGQVIGQVGSTGRSTGAHLHFEVHLNGNSVNPIGYYPHGG